MKALLVHTLALLSSSHAHSVAELTTDTAIQRIQFCKEVVNEAEAMRKAELIALLIDSNRCWKANRWSFEVHRALIAQGFRLDLFVPARHSTKPWIEVFLWYSHADGRKTTFWESCEMRDETKKFIAEHPQPSC